MGKLLAWIQASRLLAQANVAVPLLYGQALAYGVSGRFDLELLVWAQLFGLADQLFIVYANDAADAEADVANETFNLYSGGSRVVPEGKLSPRELGVGAVVAAVAMTAVSLHLAITKARPAMVGVLAAALVLLWAYSYRPIRMSYRGYGELLQGIGVGVVLPFAGYHAQTGSLDLPWLALVPSFLLAWAGNLTTALPDAPADASTAKRTYPVRHGERRGRRDSMIAIALASLTAPLAAPTGSPVAWLVAALAPLAVLAVNLRWVATADAGHRRRCLWFVTFNGGAITAAYLSWSAALVLR